MTRQTLLVAVALASLLVPASAGQEALATDDAVPLPTPLRGHSATLLEGDTLLLAGGFDGVSESARVDLVDPAAGTAASLGALLQARADHTATQLGDGRILVTGGRADGSILGTAELLDRFTGVSIATEPMRQARTDHMATLLPDGRVLLVGGVDEAGPVATAELFDPVAGSFRDAAVPLAVPLDGAAVALPDGRVLLTGDAVVTAGTVPQADGAKKTEKTKRAKKSKKKPKAAKRTDAAPQPVFAQVYDSQADQWSAVPGGGAPRGHAAAALRDGQVLLVGGMTGTADYSANQLFDPADGTFTELPPLTEPRSGHTATLLADGSVAIIGGSDYGFEVTPIEVFDPHAGTFSVQGELDMPRDGHTATLLPDGRILITGGDFASLVLDDILLYDVADGAVSPLEAVGGADDAAELDLDLPRTRADVRARHGAPNAFVILFGTPEADGSQADSRVERWSYYADGIEYVLADGEVTAAEPVSPSSDVELEPLPYDPGSFTADMGLDAIVATIGAIDDVAEPAEEADGGGRLFLADRIAWGMANDRLRYVQAFAFDVDEAGTEVPE